MSVPVPPVAGRQRSRWRKWLLGLGRSGINGLPHHLPGALAVASIIYICHHQLYLLTAIDGYTFVGIGNLSIAGARDIHPPSAQVGVVYIDQQTYEDQYLERSPLNRCELLRDLRYFYEKTPLPSVMVIDIDLSPSPLVDKLATISGIEGRKEKACEVELYKVIQSSPLAAATVLMKPFEVANPSAVSVTEEWRKGMESKGVEFGTVDISARYGLVTQARCTDGTQTVKAAKKSGLPFHNECPKRTGMKLINPSQFFKGLVISAVRDSPSRNPGGAPLIGADARVKPAYDQPIVFFGGSYGIDDTYLTPLGVMYGVEIHAAAFASLLNPAYEHYGLDYALDIAIGIGFGFIISLFWTKYFKARFSSDPFARQWAPFYVVLMLLSVMVGIIVASFISFVALTLGIWLSPVPIAIGMLIDSFFAGAVTQAVIAGHDQRQQLLGRLVAANPHADERFQRQAALERSAQPPHSKDVPYAARLAKFASGDVRALLGKGETGAAILLAFRRLLLAGLVGYVLFHIIRH